MNLIIEAFSPNLKITLHCRKVTFPVGVSFSKLTIETLEQGMKYVQS